MPDKRTHRGPHPADRKLFAEGVISNLQMAITDYSLLLTKGYAEKSALKLVGDRFSLTERQRLAVMRSVCSDEQLVSRNRRRFELESLTGESIAIDGYNVLITIEAAMSGGVILKGRDGCFRDLASVHGTYRKVTETIPAVELIGQFLREVEAGKILWLLDSPVSNSGRLKTLIYEIARKNKWDWEVELLLSPDTELKKTELIVASSDSVILDTCQRWTNLGTEIVKAKVPNAWIVNLS